MHWTQTPEGRAKMSAAQKKAYRKRRKASRAERAVVKHIKTNGHPDATQRKYLKELIQRLDARRKAIAETISTLRDEARR